MAASKHSRGTLRKLQQERLDRAIIWLSSRLARVQSPRLRPRRYSAIDPIMLNPAHNTDRGPISFFCGHLSSSLGAVVRAAHGYLQPKKRSMECGGLATHKRASECY